MKTKSARPTGDAVERAGKTQQSLCASYHTKQPDVKRQEEKMRAAVESTCGALGQGSTFW